jgi:hypothetical protein
MDRFRYYFQRSSARILLDRLAVADSPVVDFAVSEARTSLESFVGEAVVVDRGNVLMDALGLCCVQVILPSYPPLRSRERGPGDLPSPFC